MHPDYLVLSAPRSPWQNPFVERLIGTLRRDRLDHVIVLHERHLRRTIAGYLDSYHDWRTHLSLSKDAPNPRTVHPPDRGRVVEFPDIGGLHHHYERSAARQQCLLYSCDGFSGTTVNAGRHDALLDGDALDWSETTTPLPAFVCR